MTESSPALRRGMTARYSFVQASFWMSFCVAVSYAAVYLQWLGCTNTQVGLVLAAGNIGGVLLGPALSALLDRRPTLRAGRLALPLLGAQALMLLVLLLHPVRDALTLVCYGLFIGFCVSVNSMNLKLYVDAERAGMAPDYGFARGMGSLGYVLLSGVLGSAVSALSPRWLPSAGLLVLALQLTANQLMDSRLPARTTFADAQADALPPASRHFVRDNPRFCALLVGIMLLYFAHNIVMNFLINVVVRVGGDTETMGWLNAFIAATEIPVMLFFAPLFGRFSRRRLLIVSYGFFVLKGAAIALAGSTVTLFLACVLQAPSFALYTAAIVDHVDETVSAGDAARAQSLAFSMTTAGSVLASLVGGILYDRLGVSAALWISAALSLLGAVIALPMTGGRRR